MAYDVEIQTPRGRIGFNVTYHTGIQAIMLMAYLQQPDGTWLYKNMIDFAKGEIGGTPNLVMLECLVEEGILPTGSPQIEAAGWIARTPQEEALKVIIRWLVRNALAAWTAFANQILGVVVNPNPAPGPAPVLTFQSSEHALRAAFKTVVWGVNPTTSEVTGSFPA